GVALGKDFADPVEVRGAGHLGKCCTDEYAAAVLRFPGDIIAQLSAGVQLNQENVCRIYGTDGWILLPTPWVPSRNGGTSKIIIPRAGAGAGATTAEEVIVESPQPIYANEADYVAAHIAERQALTPGMN